MKSKKSYVNNGLPTIICMADCKHYLLQNFKKNLKWSLFYKASQKNEFDSLNEAKDYLRSNNVTAVNLSFQSAYDEMCGNGVNADYAITMRL